MNNENINKLIEKYWAGETSLTEEKQLQEYQSMGILEEKTAESQLLEYFANVRAQRSTRDTNTVLFEQPKLSFWKRNRSTLLSMAAALTLLAVAITAWPRSSTKDQIITDPQEALEATYAALSFMNNKIDQGRESVKEGIQLVEKTQINKVL